MRILSLLLLCGLLGGCGLASAEEPERSSFAELPVTSDVARTRLRELVRSFAGSVESAGRRIAAGTEEITIKRLSVFYRKRAVETARECLWRDDVKFAFVDLWTVCVQFEEYLSTGDGRDLFGAQQPIVVEAGQRFRVQLEGVLADQVSTEMYERARQSVYEFAKRNPLESGFSRVSLQPSEIRDEERATLFGWLPTVSLNPFGGVGEGIGEGAEALLVVGRVADRFTDVVDFLPQQIGWQLELFQYDLAEGRTIRSALAGIAQVSASAEAAVGVARELPANVRAEVEKALESIDPKLEQVRATLADVKEASGSLNGAGETFAETARAIEAMSGQLDTTLKTFQQTYILLDGDPNAPEPEPDPATEGSQSRPFDIREFEQTARSITAMAAELRQTLTTFNTLVESDKLGGRIDEVSTSTLEGVDAAVWSITRAVGVLIAAVLAAFVAYRLVSRRLARAAR